MLKDYLQNQQQKQHHFASIQHKQQKIGHGVVKIEHIGQWAQLEHISSV